MGNFFVNKFQDKSNEELQRVIDNKDQYEFEAVEAAILLLNERGIVDLPDISRTKETLADKGKAKVRSGSGFNADLFFQTFGHKDLLTAFCLALCMLATHTLLEYYSSEKWLEDIWAWLRMLTFFVFIPLNHVIYKIDHHRSNNYTGRVIHDIIFITFFFFLKLIYAYIMRYEINIFFNASIQDVAELVGTILILTILLMLFELVVALLKRLLNLIKWQIL